MVHSGRGSGQTPSLKINHKPVTCINGEMVFRGMNHINPYTFSLDRNGMPSRHFTIYNEMVTVGGTMACKPVKSALAGSPCALVHP
jgi:hypothetical protein